MTPFFSKFPLAAYDLSGTGTEYRLVRDIIHRAAFLEVVKRNAFIYYPYTVKDEETPEIIAHKLYGSAQYHWLVMFCNDIYLLWRDWPKTYRQFIAYLEKTYGSVEASQTTIHHYEDVNGAWIDYDTWLATNEFGSIAVSAFDYENAENDRKKEIRLIDAKYVTRIEQELDSILKG